MSKFYSIKIKEVKKETSDCVSIAYDIPNELKNEFQFKPGQHITTKAIIDGQDIRRSYSLCSSPNEQDFRVAIKQIDKGVFSAFANNSVNTGDTMEIMPPTGHFFININANNANKYVGFAGGSGITPIMSIIKTVMEEEPNSAFDLIYANRDESSIIFNEQFNTLKSKYNGRLTIHHILEQGNESNEDFSGYLSEDKIKKYAGSIFNKEAVAEFFLCGPAPMLDIVKDGLGKINVPEAKIKLELFTAAIPENSTNNSESHEIIDSEVTVIVDGDEFTFNLNSDQSILDAAQNEDIDVPFACKGGVCGTCKAKVEEGEVRMDANYALEPEEIENNYILTCQSHPVSKQVLIDYDVV
jgi:ring-1,2-phenylacetyl-CoA epoxidase subunit PaaE